jgi:hypothetical protein
VGSELQDATAVAFNGVPANIVPNLDPLTAIVPDGASTGPISVTTPRGIVTSLMSFTATGGANVDSTLHVRTMTLAFHGKVARGRVGSAEGFTGCTSDVPVKIQRRTQHGWRTIASDRTAPSGRYSRMIEKKRRGTYRAVATRATTNDGADVCARRISGSRH